MTSEQQPQHTSHHISTTNLIATANLFVPNTPPPRRVFPLTAGGRDTLTGKRLNTVELFDLMFVFVIAITICVIMLCLYY